MVISRKPGTVAAIGAAMALAVTGAVLSVADDGRAQAGGRTITVTFNQQPDFAFLDVGPGGLERTGRTTLGDQIFFATAARRDDGVSGRQFATVTAMGKGNLRTEKGAGFGVGVYRFPDGDISVSGVGSFREKDVDHLTVTGGTGAFAGARGTVESGPTHDVIQLLP